MRVLVLSPLVPGLGGSGGQTREHHLLRRLVELGHEVTVCCPVPASQARQLESARAAGIDVRGASRPASRVGETLAAIRARPALVPLAAARPLGPWQLEVLWQRMAPAVARALLPRPDVALVIWDLAAAWREHLPPGLPAILSLHDAGWAYAAARGAAAPPVPRELLKLESLRLRRFAAHWLPRYDGVVCVSEPDAQRVRAAAPGVSATVVDNGVDLERLTVAPAAPGPPTVIFTGTLDYPPNTEGALWLARSVWPGVRARVPDARLRIAGRRPPASVLACADADGIQVEGDVEDMAAIFRSAHVATAPLLSGGGTRLKILEAAAYGRPVVSTTLGAEGLALEAGRHLELADAPEAFAEALVRLLGDSERRARLAGAARARVEERYGWAQLGDRLAAALARSLLQ